jgi:hypothetical protein
VEFFARELTPVSSIVYRAILIPYRSVESHTISISIAYFVDIRELDLIVVASAVVVLQGVLVRSLLTSTLTSALLVVGCGGSPSPLAPSTSVGQRPTADQSELLLPRNSIQRVEEGGGGGGGQCLEGPTTPICVTVTLRTDSINLLGGGPSPFDPTASPLNFSSTGGLGVGTGVIGITDDGQSIIGRFTDGTYELTVLNGSLNIAVTLVGPFENDRGFTASGKGPAAQVQQCRIPSGATTGELWVTTTSTVQLPHLGSATIVVIRHSRLPCTA